MSMRPCILPLLVASWVASARSIPASALRRPGQLQPSALHVDLATLEDPVVPLNATAHKEGTSSAAPDLGNYAPWFRDNWAKVVASGLAVGGVFGTMGAGASMIMKPLLYYAFDQRPFKRTIFEMYLILIILASVGAIRGHLKGRVAWDHVLVVALCTSGAGTSLGALVARSVSSHVQLVFFGFLVMAVAGHMWQQAGKAASSAGTLPKTVESKGDSRGGPMTDKSLAELLTICGVASLVGLLSGFVGVGGGFMLTPLLCHLGLSMDQAVPTSLAIIALSGGAGGSWYAHLFGLSLASVNIPLVLSLAAAGCTGLLVSDHLASLLPKATRQRAFALLLVAIGTGVVFLELVVGHTAS